EQILNANRPYLIIKEDEKSFLVLTLTKNPKDKKERKSSKINNKEQNEKEEKPSFGRFGKINCPCLKKDTYIILDTKILMSLKFAEFYKLDMLTRNNNSKHQCLNDKQYLELREALEVY